MQIFFGILIGLIIGFVLYFIFFKKLFDAEGISEKIESKLKDNYQEIIKTVIDLSNDKLKAEKSEIKTDLLNKKTAIEDLVKRTLDELEKNNKRLENVENNRIGSFKALEQSLNEHKKITEQLSSNTEALKKVLSNNQMRGQFGEQVADNLLKMVGFVKGTDYEFNKEQEGSKTRPDFCIFLPDKTRINVDSKFPYSNLQKMTESSDAETKIKYAKLFEIDVKEKIKQVSTRDYINPEDKTVDFVILFIPNEMIFSYIYEKMNNVWEEAMKHKVVFAGPFNFTAILRLVKQAYNNFQIQGNISKIIGYIQNFEKEFKNYNEEFEKIGGKITSLSEQYEKVNTTRTRQLLRTVDKIKFDANISESPETPKLIG